MKEWERQERRIAKQSGGRRQSGSGSGWLHPNDVKDDEWLHEAKQTSAKSISIKAEDWEKLRKNAYAMGRKPILHLQIGRRYLVVHEEGEACSG